MVFWLFAYTTCLGKMWFLSYGRKTPRPLRIQDSLNYNISQKSWGMELNFCAWLDSIEVTNMFVAWSGCGLVCLSMPKVMTSSGSTLSQ